MSTNWERPHPQAICQDVATLERVTVFEYDLTDELFLNYLRLRIGTDPRDAGCGVERYRELDAMTVEEYINADEFRFSIERYEFTDREILSGIQTRQIRKAKFQDCWEIYQLNR